MNDAATESHNLRMAALERKFGESVIDLASHAALPVVVNPELERAQQLTALNFLDPVQAENWLRRQHGGRDREPAGREWLVAMEARLAALNERPPSTAEQPPIAVGSVLSELLRLDFEAQQH